MSNPYPGKFVTIEGPDASGKTTSINDLKKFFKRHPEILKHKFTDILFVREPGGTPISDEIRNVILSNHGDEKLHSQTQVFLFAANRYQNLKEIVIPALKAGKLVICDRFLLSTLAYQTKLINQSKSYQISEINRIMDIHKYALLDEDSHEYIVPDLTIYFDINEDTVEFRMKERLMHDKTDIDANDQAILDDLTRITRLKKQYDIVCELTRENISPFLTNVYKINANADQNSRLAQILVTGQKLLDIKSK